MPLSQALDQLSRSSGLQVGLCRRYHGQHSPQCRRHWIGCATAAGHATGEACAAGGADTNLANLADVLDVDWHDARQADDHPSGGALVFDLWRKHGRPIVRVSSMTSTLDALRHAGFHSDDALVQKTLALPPWTSHAPARHRERVARHAA